MGKKRKDRDYYSFIRGGEDRLPGCNCLPIEEWEEQTVVPADRGQRGRSRQRGIALRSDGDRRLIELTIAGVAWDCHAHHEGSRIAWFQGSDYLGISLGQPGVTADRHRVGVCDIPGVLDLQGVGDGD